MATTLSATSSPQRQIHKLSNLVQRPGCPCTLASSYQLSTVFAGTRRPLVQKYTAMQLVHKSKEGVVKNSLALGPIHHELEMASLALWKTGASNTLLSKMSFDCLITDLDGREHRDYIVFDLKIPGLNSNIEAVFCYDNLMKPYGSKANLYALLKYFYNSGRKIGNPNNFKHGTLPAYDPNSAGHDQFIRHTEQMLVAYLALPQASMMLCNRLRAEIRAKHKEACSVKVYHAGLHMHSTKTCCAPCENTFLGLMNARTGVRYRQNHFGFLTNFQRACAVPSQLLTFTFPQKQSLFRLLVTVTATEPDRDHQKQPSCSAVILKSKDPTPSFPILTRSAEVSQQIFSTLLGKSYDPRKLPTASDLVDKTVGISGSKQTPGSPSTISKVRKTRDDELDALAAKLQLLKV